MRKTIVALLLCMFPIFSLCSCGREASGSPTEGTSKGRQDASKGRQDTSKGRQDASMGTQDEEQVAAAKELFSYDMLLEEEAWRDNTLDDYTADMHVSLKTERIENQLGGIRDFALGLSCGAVFEKHVTYPPEDCWDELKTVTNQGEESSVRLAFEENTINQAFGMGSIIGSDHLMMMTRDVREGADAERRYRFFEIDEKQQIVQTIYMDFLSGDEQEMPNEIMVDKSGNIHFTASHLYFIAKSDGTLLAKYDYSGIYTRLTALYDGRVAIWSQLADNDGRRTGSRLEYADLETGKVISLAELEQSPMEEIYYTLWDEKTLLYANDKGLYFTDLSGNITGDVYIWNNHAMQVSRVEEIQIRESGRINLIYSDYDEDGNLLCLKPTEEKVEIQKIVFAVSPFLKDVYKSAVFAFNKKYPAYRIEMKTDYDETALLTELIAGEGPVLIHTQLTGFDKQKELWMPLEGLFSGEKWEDVLIPKAMEMGKIDGTLYGIVDSFSLETVVIQNKELNDWNYETFLDGIEESASIKAVCNGQQEGWAFITTFLLREPEDNYLLDVENGTSRFDSEEFRRVLRLGKTYYNSKDWIDPGETLLEGKVFCNTVRIGKPEDIDLYRLCYGEDANYIGYPGKDGSKHYISSPFPLTVRATASNEEKRVAGTFLRMMLSEECQMESSTDSNFDLSVRWDVLEEQINQVNEETVVYVSGFPQTSLEDKYNRELDAEFLYDMLEKARPGKYFPIELRRIWLEELEEYYADVITEDMLIRHLTNRVELYLKEQQ